MADQKITQLTEDTTPSLDDMIVSVNDPAGSPSTRKVSLDTLVTLFAKESIYRQALINSNFDIWQRATSSTYSTNQSLVYKNADRWMFFVSAGGGTLPTISDQRQPLSAGELDKSFYYFRTNVDGAGTSLGSGSAYLQMQRIEHGTRHLCGVGKKVTISLWARSSIANKRLAVFLNQNYGTGGSPSTQDTLVGTPVTLTSTFTKYTWTFTTSTLVGKTFGTNNDDYLELNIVKMWGTDYLTIVGAGSVETFVGSGNIDITQVQICSGDIALPYQPKSFADELRDCQRFYEKSYPYANAPATANNTGAVLYSSGTNTTNIISMTIPYKVRKRIATTPSIWDVAGNASKITTVAASSSETNNVAYGGATGDESSFYLYFTPSTVAGARFHWAVDAEL